MEATIKISVTTIIISRSEKPSGPPGAIWAGPACRITHCCDFHSAPTDRAHTSRQKPSRRMRHPPGRVRGFLVIGHVSKMMWDRTLESLPATRRPAA